MLTQRLVPYRKLWAPALVATVVVTGALAINSLAFTEQSAAAVSAATTELVSLDRTGSAAAGESRDPAISADGRHVAFTTKVPLSRLDGQYASPGSSEDSEELRPDDDVYVRDTVSGSTTLISHGWITNASGPVPFPADGVSSEPSISADGRFVAFSSYARNLRRPGGGQPTVYGRQVYVCDRGEPNEKGEFGETCHTVLVSEADDESGAGAPSISANGMQVAYHVVPPVPVSVKSAPAPGVSAAAVDLPDGLNTDTGWVTLASLRIDDDRLAEPSGADRLVMPTPATQQPSETRFSLQEHLAPALAAQGGHLIYVARYHYGYVEFGEDLFVVFGYDTTTGRLTRLDVNDEGGPRPQDDRKLDMAAVSGDGRRYAYVDHEEPSRPVVRLFDRDSDDDGLLWQPGGDEPLEGQIASRTPANAAVAGIHPAFSADGRYLAFATPAGNVHNGVDDMDLRRSCVAGDGETANLSFCDVVMRDLVTDQRRADAGLPRLPAELVSPSIDTACAAHTDGATCEGTGQSDDPALSGDGRVVAFASTAADLVSRPVDGNTTTDVYLRKFQPSLRGDAQDFGAVPMGSAAVRDVPIINAGFGPVTIGGATVAGGEFDVFPGQTCTAGPLHGTEQCVISVRFQPTVLGARSATLRLADAAGATLLEVPLSGVGLPAPQGRPVVTPTSLNFGERGVLRLSGAKTVTVRNSGDGPLQMFTVRIGGVAPADYRISSDTCANRSVPVGGTCRVQIRHSPKAVGARGAVLLLDHAGPAPQPPVTPSPSTSASTSPPAPGTPGAAPAPARLTVTVPLSGAGTAPVLTTLPRVARSGQVIRVTGVNFPPNSQVRLSLDRMVGAKVVKADASGSFEVPLLIYANTSEGRRPLRALVLPTSAPGLAGPLEATIDFLVVPGSLQPPGFQIRS